MSLWSHLCCLGYGIEARCSALWHLIRGHRIHWRDHAELWIGCTGDIWCEACPDSSDGKTDLCMWVRHWYWIGWVGERVCGWLGHPGFHHPTRGMDGEPILDEWFCVRCGFSKVDVPVAKA